MPSLGDYLGQLMSEIAIARMQADLETVRLAELYASHPLLKHLPVPHLRLPDVDVDVPILIDKTGDTSESPRGTVLLKKVQTAFVKVLDAELEKEDIKLTQRDKQRLSAAIKKEIQDEESRPEIRDTSLLADKLSKTSFTMIRKLRPVSGNRPTLSESAMKRITDAVRKEFIPLRQPPPRLAVKVTSAELANTGNENNIARIKLKINEQGVEWNSVEIDGQDVDKLLPE